MLGNSSTREGDCFSLQIVLYGVYFGSLLEIAIPFLTYLSILMSSSESEILASTLIPLLIPLFCLPFLSFSSHLSLSFYTYVLPTPLLDSFFSFPDFRGKTFFFPLVSVSFAASFAIQSLFVEKEFSEGGPHNLYELDPLCSENQELLSILE